jgi:hypothetical protein
MARLRLLSQLNGLAYQAVWVVSTAMLKTALLE